jgi:hypothetical protein
MIRLTILWLVHDLSRRMEKRNSTRTENVKKLLFKGISSVIKRLKVLVRRVTTQTKRRAILVECKGGLLINATNNGRAGAKITHGNSVPERKPPGMGIQCQLKLKAVSGSGTGFSTGLI